MPAHNNICLLAIKTMNTMLMMISLFIMTYWWQINLQLTHGTTSVQNIASASWLLIKSNNVNTWQINWQIGKAIKSTNLCKSKIGQYYRLLGWQMQRVLKLWFVSEDKGISLKVDLLFNLPDTLVWCSSKWKQKAKIKMPLNDLKHCFSAFYDCQSLPSVLTTDT